MRKNTLTFTKGAITTDNFNIVNPYVITVYGGTKANSKSIMGNFVGSAPRTKLYTHSSDITTVVGASTLPPPLKKSGKMSFNGAIIEYTSLTEYINEFFHAYTAISNRTVLPDVLDVSDHNDILTQPDIDRVFSKLLPPEIIDTFWSNANAGIKRLHYEYVEPTAMLAGATPPYCASFYPHSLELLQLCKDNNVIHGSLFVKRRPYILTYTDDHAPFGNHIFSTSV